MEIKKYISRLLEEWKQHGKLIIAVDYDDTLRDWKMADHVTYTRVMNLLKACKQTGAYVVVFTSCNEDRYSEISVYCANMGLQIDGINQNPIVLPYGTKNKIYANIFLDDRAGLNEALTILEETLYQYRGYLQTQRNIPDVA